MSAGGRAQRLLEARWNGPRIVSYAQNAEDVRLYRVFGSQPSGFYVDIGAGDPIVGSVTKLFYDRGWSGINIEPGPPHTLLEAARPRDINLKVAISVLEGSAELWVSSPDPGLSSLTQLPVELVPTGFTQSPTPVETARLETVLSTHAKGRAIDFLKIDVEGAERDVLESFDAGRVRPTVVVVEAIAPLDNHPTHEEWDDLLLDTGFLLATFDGINRYYVPSEHAELIPVLAYPTCALDQYERARPTTDSLELEEVVEQRDRAAREIETWRRSAEWHRANRRQFEVTAVHATSTLAEVQRTLSWRVTRPLRAARGFQRTLTTRRRRRPTPVQTENQPRDDGLESAFADRLLQTAAVLGSPSTSHELRQPLRESIAVLEAALASAADSRAAAWLSLVAVDGVYPDESDVESTARLLRTSGPQAVGEALLARFSAAVQSGVAPTAALEIVRDGVVVDVTHTVSTDLHTGIQRVVRETVPRWLETSPEMHLVHFRSPGGLRLLADDERSRMTSWRSQFSRSGAPISTRVPANRSDGALVPWRCRLIIPELPDRGACSALRALAKSRVLTSLSLISFDFIPVVAAETVSDGISETFCEYLSLLKHADHVSAISESSADAVRAFGRMLEGENLSGPVVRSHSLPTVVPRLGSSEIESARRALEVDGSLPLILVVGSHEPRKNHLVVLEAAERLWQEGRRFELLMIGGSHWRSTAFESYVEHLQEAGWPVTVRRRVSERDLWAAYELARFTVYPSLLEGFGLPVAESLAAGTPVITSHHGSMAEIASGGGALLVDPRDVGEVGERMRLLLADDDALGRLQEEAHGRDLGNWDDYARDVWSFFEPTRAADATS